MKTVRNLIVLFSCLSSIFCQAQQKHQISSPDGNIVVDIVTGTTLTELLTYTTSYKNQKIIAKGKIGVSIKENMNTPNMKIVGTKAKAYNKTWKPVYGEREMIRDNYNLLTLTYATGSKLAEKVSVYFRLYNEGFAFKYVIANKEPLTLLAEQSDFTFVKNDTAWVTTTAQGIFKKKTINDISEASERPMTLKYNENIYYALGEAGLVDYARMKLINRGPQTLGTILHSKIKKVQLESPWRYIIFGNSAGDLLEKNYLLLNLNEPNQIKNTKWIIPGKVIRENSLTTIGSYQVIDFAAAHQIKYVSFDAGWYGKEDADTSDARRVMIDPARSKGPLDLQKVIDYAKQKDIGIILYVNRRALERQLDELLPLYKKWGIKGIKFGFVQVGSQQWTNWLHEAIRKCANYEMLVDVHDEYRPTGYARTYPNLMTQEGIRGDEESPTNELVLTTLFTRMIAGAGDQTNAYFTKRIEKMGSRSSQMAKSILIYSPLQFIYWYDRPAPKNTDQTREGIINELPDLAHYDNLPTVWQDTKVLESSISNYATIARRKDKDWYIGSITDKQRTLTLNLNFLTKGLMYNATIYTDDANSTSPTKVKITTQKVDSSTILSFLIKANNGLAIRIIPTN